MKKVIYTIILTVFTLNAFTQIKATTESGKNVILNDDGTYAWVEDSKKQNTDDESGEELFIAKHVDDMTDKIYYYSSKKLICTDKAKGEGFGLYFDFSGKSDKSIKIRGLSMKVVGLECLEDTELLFLFDDESKLSLKSWNDFNCKGNAWYQLSDSQLKMLSTKTIKKIRVQNGRNYKSFTQELEGEDKRYLIEMYKVFDRKDIRRKQFKE